MASGEVGSGGRATDAVVCEDHGSSAIRGLLDAGCTCLGHVEGIADPAGRRSRHSDGRGAAAGATAGSEGEGSRAVNGADRPSTGAGSEGRRSRANCEVRHLDRAAKRHCSAESRCTCEGVQT